MPDITPFGFRFKWSIIVSVLGIFVCRLLYKGKGHLTKLLESFILLPIVLPPTVLGFILLIIFSPRSVVGQFLKTYYIFQHDRCLSSFPLMYQHTIQGFRSINPKMLNTARTMGQVRIKYSIV